MLYLKFYADLFLQFINEKIRNIKSKQNKQKNHLTELIKDKIKQVIKYSKQQDKVTKKMSSGHFSRTNRTTPQRNIGKTQQTPEPSTNPSQISSGATQQTPKGGYVYKPSSRMARTTGKITKQSLNQITQTKGQQPVLLPSKVQYSKPVSLARKPLNETQKQKITANLAHKIEQVKEQTKPVVRPISRLIVNRNNESLQPLESAPPKIQQPIKEVPFPIAYKQNNNKQPVQGKVQPETSAVVVNVVGSGNQRNAQLVNKHNRANSAAGLDINKPASFTYPKKLSRRGVRNQDQQQEQPTQSKNAQKQTLKQTPKSDRYRVQQKPQDPAVSGFSYQRKPVEKVQGSQPDKTVRTQPQSVVQSPIIKAQQKNLISPTLVQSPATKSLLSYASRYRKVQTPKAQQKQTQQQTPELPVRRSPLIIFSLHKLFSWKLSQNYTQFSGNLKQSRQNQRPDHAFESSLSKFVHNFQNKVLLRGAFSVIKTIYYKLAKGDYSKSIDPRTSNQLTINRNKCFWRVVQNILLPQTSLAKGAFAKLNDNCALVKAHQKRLQLGATILGDIQTKRVKQCLYIIREGSMLKSRQKQVIMSRCSFISMCYKKWILKQTLNKLSLFKLRELASQLKLSSQVKLASKVRVASSKPEKKMQRDMQAVEEQQPQANRQLKQKVAQLQAKISELRQRSDEQLSQKQLRVSELKQQIVGILGQLQNRRELNQKLKARLQMLKSKSQAGGSGQFSSLSDNGKVQTEEPTLALVHEIYMKVFRQSQQQCTSQENVDSLRAVQRGGQSGTSRETVAKWLAVHQNLQLKHHINLYEGNYAQGDGSQMKTRGDQIYKQLEQQNKTVKTFLRSYIKERYMWEQIKQCVAAVINQ